MHLTVIALALCLAQPPDEPKQDPDRFAKWEKEVAAIEKRLTDDPPGEGAVFFTGSSSIRLWDLKKSFPGAGHVNVGFGGSVVADSAHFAPRLITPHRPKAVVLYAGDNDVAAGRTPEQVLADFKAFCAAVWKDVPRCRVLFVSIKPSALRWKQFDGQTRANALVRDFCKTDDRLAFVDVVPLMLDPDGRPRPDLFARDGLHLSPAGYERWTAAVGEALKK